MVAKRDIFGIIASITFFFLALVIPHKHKSIKASFVVEKCFQNFSGFNFKSVFFS